MLALTRPYFSWVLDIWNECLKVAVLENFSCLLDQKSLQMLAFFFFPQYMKCAYILTFFFRINNFWANKQKGRDIHLFFFFKHILYMKKAITEGLEVITAIFLCRKGNNLDSGKVACWQGSQSHGSPKEVKRLVF